jgi:hypothetical protein
MGHSSVDWGKYYCHHLHPLGTSHKSLVPVKPKVSFHRRLHPGAIIMILILSDVSMISTPKFVLLLILYIIISLAIFLGVNNTEAAFLYYMFTLLPLYFWCIIECNKFERCQNLIELKRSLSGSIIGILISQVLIVISAPSDCFMWHQGRACYSFLQAYLENTSGMNHQDPLHWDLFELIFPMSLLLYAISTIVFMKSLQIKKIY